MGSTFLYGGCKKLSSTGRSNLVSHPRHAGAFSRVRLGAAGRSTEAIQFRGVHHVGFLCADLERSMRFYRDTLGLEVNPERPHDRLPYAGAWLWVGPEMIHLMELPNPDPLQGRAQHGGRDRHVCVGVDSIEPLKARLEAAGVEYTASKSGRAALFFRDCDMNTIEAVELQPWR